MDFEKELQEAEVFEVSEAEQLTVRDLGKEERWKKKRCGKITSSTLPNLMKGGRSKGIEWGEGAKDVLYGVKYERRTGLMRETKDFIKNFTFGKEHEPSAFEWLKQNGYPDIKNSDDFEDIIFHEPFENFGDSPDFIGYELVGEIKCNISQEKFEKMMDEKVIHDKSEYYEQFLGHLIGMPEAKKLVFCNYDPVSGKGHVIEMLRKDHLDNIEKLEQRINDGNKVVDASIAGKTTISEINEFLKS